jgi:hypothetical protein
MEISCTSDIMFKHVDWWQKLIANIVISSLLHNFHGIVPALHVERLSLA